MISETERYYGLGMDAQILGCFSSTMLSQMGDSMRSSSQMLSNMDDTMAGAWMLCLSDAHKHGRYTAWARMLWGCSQTWKIVWLWNRFFLYRRLSNIDEVMAWAWILWLSSALEHGRSFDERHYGLGMVLLNMDDTMTWARATHIGRCPGYEIPVGKLGPHEPYTKKL